MGIDEHLEVRVWPSAHPRLVPDLGDIFALKVGHAGQVANVSSCHRRSRR